MPKQTEKSDKPELPPGQALAQAKRKLLNEAEAFDVLGPVRRHPLILVGSAALLGGIIGSSGGTVFGLAKITSSLMGILRPIAVMGTRAALMRAATKNTVDAMKKESETAVREASQVS